MTGRRRYQVGRVRGGRAAGITLDEDVMAARSDILAAMTSWAAIVVKERGLPQPPPRGCAELARFLGGHAEWLAGRPVARSIAEKADALASVVRRALQSDQSVRVDLGSCGHRGCDRTVSAVIGEGGAPVRCAAGHVLRPAEWLKRVGKATQ
ncbi:hypothetical protein [Actinocrispum wychmicini]|uniref:hypothetical protein n=1 Tax=Actinocrispum wychmicini TaxID=1213861 RepID=UPI00104E6955|nr:hypothetical protein [Actinocrispum wychmicini]